MVGLGIYFETFCGTAVTYLYIICNVKIFKRMFTFKATEC